MSAIAGQLDLLFRPRSVAIVGASSDFRRVGGRPVHFLKQMHYKGSIYPINSRRDVVQGLPSFPGLGDVPTTPDVAIIALPAKETIAAVEAAAQIGVPFAIIFSDGFAEAGEQQLQQQLTEAAAGRVRIVGPNCPGLVNFEAGIPLAMSSFLSRGPISPGGLAVISQSGGVATPLIARAQDRHVGLSFYVAPGNQADLTVEDFIEYAIEDRGTTSIGCVVEGIRDASRFHDLCLRARDAGKPVIVLKMGRSSAAAASAMSHTGSQVGTYEAYRALFASAGVVEAVDPDDIFELSRLLSGTKPVQRRGKVGILSFSGGGATLLADRASAHNLAVPPLSAQTLEGLRGAYHSAVKVGRNPMDLTGHVLHEQGIFAKVLGLFLAEPAIDALVLGAFLAAPDIAIEMARSIVERAALTSVPIAVVAPSGKLNDKAYAILEKAGVSVFLQPDKALRAVNCLIGSSRCLGSAHRSTASPSGKDVGPLIGRFTLQEAEAKALLAEAGVQIPSGFLVDRPSEGAGRAEKLGYPLVVKISARNLPHKTDAGLVRVGVRDQQQYEDVSTAMLARAKQAGIAKPLLLIEELVVAPYEVFVGFKRDPLVGCLVAIGFGGIYSEVFGDYAVGIAPLEEAGALRLIHESKVGRLLRGVRGQEPADLRALSQLISAASHMVAANHRIVEVDLNPVFVGPDGSGLAIAADANFGVENWSVGISATGFDGWPSP